MQSCLVFFWLWAFVAERRHKTGGIRCTLRGAHSELTHFYSGGEGLKNIWTTVYKMPLAGLFLSPIAMVYSQLLCICLGFHGDHSWRGESRSPSAVSGSVTCAASCQPLTPSHCFLDTANWRSDPGPHPVLLLLTL